jgi:hypothetical protein
MGKRNYQRQNQQCQKIRNWDPLPTFHETPVAIDRRIPASTPIKLPPLSIEGL